jgi:hypothetical protein
VADRLPVKLERSRSSRGFGVEGCRPHDSFKYHVPQSNITCELLLLMSMSIVPSTSNIEVRNEEARAAEVAFPDADQSTFRNCYTRIICHLREGGAVLPELLDGLMVRQPKYRQCPFKGCGKHFKRRDRARAHIRKHLEDRPFACYGGCGDPNW